MTHDEIKQKIKEKVIPHIDNLGYDPADFYVCGGCIASMINDEDVSDFDVYCKSSQIAEGLTEGLWVGEDYGVLTNTGNAITFDNDVQIITRFNGDPYVVIEKFDFLHTQTFYDLGTDVLHITERVENTIKSKSLIYTGSEYPVSTLLRIQKYVRRGWLISAVEHMRIIMDVAVLDLEDNSILKDQLLGVDLGDFFNDEGEVDLSWKVKKGVDNIINGGI